MRGANGDFFITYNSHERESEVQLSFYITREKTSVSASFSYVFPVILLLSSDFKSVAASSCGWSACASTFRRAVEGAGICGCLLASIWGI